MDVPAFVSPGPQNPMGARAMYLFEGNKDTLYRIHGTNQPEYIGQAISSGCIRMTNEDVIDLYKRVKTGHGRGGAGAAPGRLAVQSAAGVDRRRVPLKNYTGAEKTAPSGAVFVFRRQAPSVTRTISGGTPSRSGTLLQPSPPDTIMWRPCSTMWP